MVTLLLFPNSGLVSTSSYSSNINAQALARQRELGIDNAKLKVNGRAIAIGHPPGCSGARLATTLMHQMARTGASRGIGSLCVGVGQGLATILERE